MNLKKNIILLTRKLPQKIEEKLQKKYTVILNKSDKKYTYAELKKKVSQNTRTFALFHRVLNFLGIAVPSRAASTSREFFLR